jgi:hypothetical protein
MQEGELALYKVTRRFEGYTMVVAYSSFHAEKIASTLDEDQFAPDVEYAATEITQAADIPQDWRDLCPWPEHGSTYLEDDITYEEALALLSARRRRQSALARHGYRCSHCDADISETPSRVYLVSSGEEQELRPFCDRCSEELFAGSTTKEI